MHTTVFENGAIHTLDDGTPTAAALSVCGERITAVGTVSHCREVAGAGARRVDLGGATVVPGLTDSHIHTAELARSKDSADLRGAPDLPAALERVRRHAAALPPGGWVTGGGWDCHTWPVPVQPNRGDLDSVVAGRPAALFTVDEHTVWVNSAALAALGIDRRTPDPVGGQIVRDSSGEPTGILRESATKAVRDVGTGTDPGRLASQMRRTLAQLLSVGLTSIHDIDGDDARVAFETLRAAGDLPLRVHKSIPLSALADAIAAGRATGDGDSWLRTGPVKLFTDGAVGSHSALMSDAYRGEPDNYGMAVTAYPELLRLIGLAGRAGIAVAAHAIGDQANHLVLKAFDQAADALTGSRLRHRIEHAQFLQPPDVAAFARLGVIASMQPTHCTSDIPLTDAVLGDRGLAGYAWASLLAAGACVAFGSDAPVEDPNPWHGIHAAVTRRRRDGTPSGGWHPAERISLEGALRCYTTAPAYASYEEHVKGRLRPGMLADFIVLSADPFTADPATLHEITVNTAIVGGLVRFSR